jgi:glycosyltransferase involved in cell wall biosynthesis
MSVLGVIAIGRNEGERLRRCFDALSAVDATIVYVDSGSTDDSLAIARARGVEVVALDMSAPFSAARARNAGFERLERLAPQARFVQFLDGDCEVADGWLDRACRVLEEQAGAAVVFGRRNEQFPERSIYNRLAAVEWNVPISTGGQAGAPLSCGGDSMMRAEAFRAVGGFNPSLPAGEEPELCQRLRGAGWSVVRLDADMTWHDSAIFRFSQWARRQVRTGYGALDFTSRFGQAGDNPFRRQVLSARFWALVWPLALIVGAGLAAWLGGPVAGWAVGGLMAMAVPLQACRIALRSRSQTGGLRVALTYGILTMVGKSIQMGGQILYLRDRLSGRHARLIEYKFAAPETQGASS